jgi:hypothetical protein|tara:strand:- start:3929 stop:4318 length:390 start_codon:yes stop_codon:yes gene_type:complete
MAEVTAYLVAESVASAVGTDLFEDALPEAAPDTAMAVILTPGQPSEKEFGSVGIGREFPSIQFLSRAVSYDTARANCERAHVALGKVDADTLSSTFYERADPTSPFIMDVDPSGRVVYALNAQLIKDPS